MRYQMITWLPFLLMACATLENNAMNDLSLSVSAVCRNNEQCLFAGKDILLDITITNTGSDEFRIPFAYLKKTGPVIRLLDERKKTETYLKKNLASHALRDEFTAIGPGKSLTFEWVITSSELSEFGSRPLDVKAEITIATKARFGGKLTDYTGTTMIRIRGDGNP